MAIAAVVRHDDILIAARFELVFQNQQIFAAEAHDAVHLCAQAMQFLGDGVCDGAAHAAAHHGHFFEPLHMRGNAQRAHEIGDKFAFLFMV